MQAGKRPIFALASFAAARKSCRRHINNAIVRQVDLYGKEERKNSSKWKKKKHKSLSIHFTQCLLLTKTKHCDICGYHRFWMVVNFSFMLEIHGILKLLIYCRYISSKHALLGETSFIQYIDILIKKAEHVLPLPFLHND